MWNRDNIQGAFGLLMIYSNVSCIEGVGFVLGIFPRKQEIMMEGMYSVIHCNKCWKWFNGLWSSVWILLKTWNLGEQNNCHFRFDQRWLWLGILAPDEVSKSNAGKGPGKRSVCLEWSLWLLTVMQQHAYLKSAFGLLCLIAAVRHIPLIST